MSYEQYLGIVLAIGWIGVWANLTLHEIRDELRKLNAKPAAEPPQ